MQDLNQIEPKNNGVSAFINSIPPFVFIILVLGIIFMLYQVLGGLITLIAIGTDTDSNKPLLRVILSAGQFLFILAPVVFFARLQTPSLSKMFRLRMPDPWILLFSVLAITFVNPAIQGYMVLQSSILENVPYYDDLIKPLKNIFDELDTMTAGLVTAYSTLEFIIVVFVIAVTPAICEEFLFRGIVMRNMERIAKPAIVIFVTGFLFAVYHFHPFNLIPLIVLGVFISFSVYYSNSILTGIIVHFINNFYAAYMMYKYGKEVNIPSVENDPAALLIIGISSFVLFLISCYIIYKLGKRKEEKQYVL